MKKSVLIIAVISIFVSTIPVFAEYSKSNVRVYKGWNLLGNGSDYPRDLINKAEYVYAYIPLVNKYFPLKPELKEDEKNRFIEEIKIFWKGNVEEFYKKYMIGAYWYYFPEDTTVSMDVSDGDQYLIGGWNFKYVPPFMAGKKFDDITGDCVIQRAFGYDAIKARDGNSPWQNLIGFYLPNEKASGTLGQGMVIKVEKACKLGVKNMAPSIPRLPD